MNKGTIIRTILLAVCLANMILKYTGHNPIPADESSIGELVDCVLSTAIIILTYWKNNSWTKHAKKADEYLKKLKELEEE